MTAANKVRYGLKKLYRAEVTRAADGSVNFGKPVKMPGAVSMTLTPEGSDPQDFYADDGIYYTIEGTNGGYSCELVVARVSDEDRVALLGEVLDDNGVQFETTEAKSPEYAYIMEMQGNFSPIAFCFYCGKASRIAMNANTKGESVEVDTDTISIRFTSVELDFGNEKKNVIQGHIEKSEENADKYNAFFESVAIPTVASSETGTETTE